MARSIGMDTDTNVVRKIIPTYIAKNVLVMMPFS